MRRPEAPWWWETWVITRAVFSVLFWPLVALTALLVAIGALVLAFAIHWGWGVLAVALIASAVALALWWGRGRLPSC